MKRISLTVIAVFVCFILFAQMDNIRDVECYVSPAPNAFEMKLIMNCGNSSDHPVHSMSTPLVADIDGDGVTEILGCKCRTTWNPFYSDGFHVFDGQSGEYEYTIQTASFSLCGQPVTIADVNKDGKGEIFLMSSDLRAYCYNYRGEELWHSNSTLGYAFVPMIADINNDGYAEAVYGKYIFDAQTGVLLHTITLNDTGMGWGAPHGVETSYTRGYYLAALADIDGDNTLELCAGNSIYKITLINRIGTSGNSSYTLRTAENISAIPDYDGQTFIVDFDADGDIDICVLGLSHTSYKNSYVYVWDGQTNTIIANVSVPLRSNSGLSIPYAGDLNGDGKPEIVFNGKAMFAYYYDPASPGNMHQLHNHTPFSETVGFTVFDFNQDNKMEIVYRGDEKLYIVDGETLQNLCTPWQTYSGTVTECPVIADVNGDGQAELIITRAYNRWGWGDNYGGSASVYGSSEPFNTFLAQNPIINTNGDLYIPTADAELTACAGIEKNGLMEITLSFCNNGDISLIAPFNIAVYLNKYHNKAVFIGTIEENLHVGECLTKTINISSLEEYQTNGDSLFVIAVNDDGHGIAQHGNQQAECDTTNNMARVKISGSCNDTTRFTPVVCESELPYTHVESGIVFPIGTASHAKASKTLTNQAGCDSIIQVNLTVLPTQYGDTSATFCAGTTFFWRGDTYTEEGDYTKILTSAMGCDSIVTLHLTETPTPDMTIRPNITIKPGESVLMWANGVDFCRWEPENSLIKTDELKIYAKPTTTTTYTATGYIITDNKQNVVYNGNFDAGNTGFTTSLNYFTPYTTIGGFGTYTISNDVKGFWQYYIDSHTAFGGSGNMMIVDGKTTPNSIVWSQKVQVEPDTYYAFSAQVMSCWASNMEEQYALLQFSVNGSQLGPVFHSPSVLYSWEQFYQIWYSGNNTTATLTILNQNSNGLGNDFAIDEIRLDALSYSCEAIRQVTIRIEGGDTDSLEIASICAGETYTWHGKQFKTTTTVTEIIPNTAGADSICTLQLTVHEPTDSIEVATICAGNSYTWHGRTFRTSTTQTETLTNAAGCDSVCTLRLKVLPALSGDTSATFCKRHTFVWHGTRYADPGDYTYTYASKTAPYCDSIVTLHLSQKESLDSIEVATICAGETYTWHGRTYNATTTQTETLTNAAGCDSVCTLRLTVLPALSGDTSATFCKGHTFVWHGTRYADPGDYTYTYASKTAPYCDSIVTLHLSQQESSDSVEIATICAGETYTWHGRTYNATTVQTEILTNAAGCDSVCTLRLNVLPNITTDFLQTITDGTSYSWNGELYTAAGDYTQSFTANNGCDSIVTLHLTVNQLTYEILTHPQCADDPYVEFEIMASDGLIHQLQFTFSQKALEQHFRDTLVTYTAPIIQIPNSARAGIYNVTISPLCDNHLLSSRDYQFTLLYPSSVLDQHWDDFIGVLTHNYNGGYDFVSFQWYKNGQPLEGENHSYTYQPLEMGTAYSAMLEEPDGTKLMTCEFIATPKTEITLYPTLLKPHQIIRLHSPESIIVWVYDTCGRMIYTNVFDKGENTFAAPQNHGMYIIKMQQTGKQGKTNTKKVIVK